MQCLIFVKDQQHHGLAVELGAGGVAVTAS